MVALVLFAIFLVGWLEFVLTVLLMLDRLWQFLDYHRDTFDTILEQEEVSKKIAPLLPKEEVRAVVVPVGAIVTQAPPEE